MFRKSLLAVMVSGLMVAGVQAAENQVNGYLFGNIGQAESDLPRYINDLDAGLASEAANLGWGFRSSLDDKDTAFKVGVGVQLNRYIGVEFQYIDLGAAEYKATVTDGIDTATVKAAADTDGYGMNLVGSLPFDRFKLFGKVGYHKLETDLSAKITDGVDTLKVSDSEKEWITSYGIGASYAFTPQLELVAEYEQYRDVADEYDVDFGSIGLRYNF